MNKLLKNVIALPLLLAGSQLVLAGSITCDLDFDADPLRTVTLSNNTGVSCGPSGITAGGNPEGNYFTSLGYNKLSKINDVEGGDGTGTNDVFSITGLGDATGEFELLPGLTDILAVFKLGGGTADPDWISFAITGITESGFTANWSTEITPESNSTQTLSHVTIYGNYASVPEPATAMLLGLGILGLAFSRRRAKTSV